MWPVSAGRRSIFSGPPFGPVSCQREPPGRAFQVQLPPTTRSRFRRATLARESRHDVHLQAVAPDRPASSAHVRRPRARRERLQHGRHPRPDRRGDRVHPPAHQSQRHAGHGRLVQRRHAHRHHRPAERRFRRALQRRPAQHLPAVPEPGPGRDQVARRQGRADDGRPGLLLQGCRRALQPDQVEGADRPVRRGRLRRLHQGWDAHRPLSDRRAQRSGQLERPAGRRRDAGRDGALQQGQVAGPRHHRADDAGLPGEVGAVPLPRRGLGAVRRAQGRSCHVPGGQRRLGQASGPRPGGRAQPEQGHDRQDGADGERGQGLGQRDADQLLSLRLRELEVG